MIAVGIGLALVAAALLLYRRHRHDMTADTGVLIVVLLGAAVGCLIPVGGWF